jgi:geranylgeranyl pyrophosphate synthase
VYQGVQMSELEGSVGAGELTDLLRAVEARVLAEIDGVGRPLRDVIRPIASGGKRLRARLVWAWSTMGPDPSPAHVVDLMVAIELLHLSTLIHDDAIDESACRRGHPSVFAVAGPSVSLLLGDRLLAGALGTAGSVAGSAVVELCNTLVVMCDAQQAELESAFDLTRTRDAVREVAGGKTGRLFEAACVLGARAVGAEPEVIDGVRAFGLQLGTAFQLIDDLADFVHDSDDLSQGIYTTPVVLTLAGHEGARTRAALEPLVGWQPELLEAARSVDGLADAAQEALDLVASARAVLDGFEGFDPAGRQELDGLCQLLIDEARALQDG